MSDKIDFGRYKNLSFEDLRRLAADDNISMYEKIGFPDAYRQGRELDIFLDIVNKLGADVNDKGKTWLDIGPGCTELPLMVLDFCKNAGHSLIWTDSKEMLRLLPDDPIVQKVEGYFPDDMAELMARYKNSIDYIVSYSVLHCGPFYNTCMFKFIDAALAMLKPGGRMLIGDIANVSKRRRFFSSETGVAFHKQFMNTETPPVVDHLHMESEIDDGTIFGILMRYRGFGFETYLLPQGPKLPMYNRREDILICKI